MNGERPVSAMLRVDSENPGHTTVTVFAGRNPGARGHSGTLVFRTDEWNELIERGMTSGGTVVLEFDLIGDRNGR